MFTRPFRLMALAASLGCGLSLPLSTHAAPTLITQALSTMAPNSWQRLNLNTFVSVIPQDSQLPIMTTSSPTSNISSWSGAAWDSKRGNLLIWGGDYGGDEGNEVYVWNGGTGLWGRGSLPSQVTPPNANGVMTTVDGVAHAPTSGESYDNLVYLKGVDRLGVVGASRNGETWLNPDGTVTGPYFWDPAKADPNQVGGLTGSHVNPASFADVVGGQMWQNRNSGAQMASFGISAQGTSDAITVDGKDIVYLTDEYDNLWRYTVSGLDPSGDTFERIGSRPFTGETGWGSGAIDVGRGIYVKTVRESMFGFWLLNTGLNADANMAMLITPRLVDASLTTPDFRNFGMEYDPELGVFTLWDGSRHVWLLKPPALLDGTGEWLLERLDVAGEGPHIPEAYTGVYGKWQYLEDVGAFIGVIDPLAGDVYLYKPLGAEPASSGGGLVFNPVPVGLGGANAVPEPGLAALVLAAGAGAFFSLRRLRLRRPSSAATARRC